MSERNPASDRPGAPPRRRPTGTWAVIALLLGVGIVVPLMVRALRLGDAGAVRLPVLLLVPVRDDPGGLAVHVHRLPAVAARDRAGPRPPSASRPSRAPTAVSSDERRRARGLPVLLPAGHDHGLRRLTLAPGRVDGQPRRVGPGRSWLRHVHHVVPDRRRHLHRLHVHRRAGDVVRRVGGRLLRGALHDRALPDHLHLPAAVLVGVAPARLRHARRLRARPLRLEDAGARRGRHRPARDDALHRAPAGRHPGGAGDHGHRRERELLVAREGRSAADRVRRARGVHLRLRPPRPRADRVRQGHPDLHRHPGRGVLPADPARRLGQHLRLRQGLVHDVQHGERVRDRGRDRAGQGHHAAGRGALGLRVAGPRLGSRAVHVPALVDRRAGLEEPVGHPSQRGAAPGVLLPAGAARPARLRRHRRRA